jgi:hypothetical protein
MNKAQGMVNTARNSTHPAPTSDGRDVERSDTGGTTSRPFGDTPPAARPAVPATDNRPNSSPLPPRPDNYIRER